MAIGYSRYGYGYPGYSDHGSYGFSFAVAPAPKPTVPKVTFKEGDKVNVKIDTTAVVEFVNEDGTVDLKFPDSNMNILEYVPAKCVTLQDPANWPPKPGQVWATPDGKLHGVRHYAYGTGPVVYRIDQPNDYYSDYSSAGRKLADFKTLRPVLVR